jgi:hypothetical protein
MDPPSAMDPPEELGIILDDLDSDSDSGADIRLQVILRQKMKSLRFLIKAGGTLLELEFKL